MPLNSERTTVRTILEKKKKGEKICSVTAYDFPTAQLASAAGIDLILVGDSLGMVMQGRPNTLAVTLEEMIYHTRQVSRAEPVSLVATDMPFGSFHLSERETAANAIRCIKEGGAEAVKVEGGRRRFRVIEAILAAEIPVIGHLGLTPQSVHQLGGFTVQGKQRESAREIYEDALELAKIGVFCLVLESIPLELGKKITENIGVPTIGIGAGPHCDGQILVFQDLVGLTHQYLPKFVRRYADLHTVSLQALEAYVRDIRAGSFPGEAESYHGPSDIDSFFQ